MRRITSAVIVTAGLGLVALAGDAAAADAKISDIDIAYDLLIAGAPAAELELNATLNENSYQVRGVGQTTGLIDLLVRMRFSGSTEGQVRKAVLLPASHSHHYKERGTDRRVRIDYGHDGRAAVVATPPYDPSLSRVPLTEDKLFGVVDPASVFIVPAVPGHGPLDAAQCDREVGVINGQIRVDIAMRHSSSAAHGVVHSAAYEGPLIRCNLKVTPVGGHKRGKFLDRLSEADDIDVWLAPVAGGRYLVPLRLSLPTPLGRAELDARRLSERPAELRAGLGK